MYTNTSKRDTINIINDILENNPEINMNIRKEIIHMSNSDGTELLPI
jgi:hypothetical protein